MKKRVVLGTGFLDTLDGKLTIGEYIFKLPLNLKNKGFKCKVIIDIFKKRRKS